jgi:hypothetical protein
MASNRSLDSIITALGAVLMAAPQRDSQALRITQPVSARRFVTCGTGNPAHALRTLVDEVIEAVDAQPE